MVETSATRPESLLPPPKNLRDASSPAARFSLGPPTGSRTVTSDVEIAGYRVKPTRRSCRASDRAADWRFPGVMAGMAGLTMARNGPLSTG